jgi:histidyl-tRNA synthetase
MKLATGLRSKGIRTDADMTGRKLKKSMDYANKEGIPYVIILGEDELREEKAVQKDMLNGQEYETGMDGLVQALSRMLPG